MAFEAIFLSLLTLILSLFFLLGFHFLLMGLDDGGGDIGRYHIIVIQLHSKVTAPTCDRAQLGSVVAHFRHWDVSNNCRIAMFRFRALHASTACIEIAHHIAHIGVRDRHTHFHDWLEQHGTRALHRKLESLASRNFKGHWL